MSDKKCFYVDIKSNQDTDGKLLVLEGNSKQFPFEIKRVFWIRDIAQDCKRGQHANKNTKLILIAIKGSCDVVVNDGTTEKTYRLDDPTKGLFIGEMLWRTMQNFSEDCILEAICDHVYDPVNETYDDFNEYLQAIGKQKQ